MTDDLKQLQSRVAALEAAVAELHGIASHAREKALEEASDACQEIGMAEIERPKNRAERRVEKQLSAGIIEGSDLCAQAVYALLAKP